MSTTDTKTQLDATLVNAIVSATKDIFLTMANFEVGVKEVKPQLDYSPTGDISALIGIVGERGEGMLSLSFPIDLASEVVSSLLGTSKEKITASDRTDGVGELVNMISGNAKTILSRESGSSYTLSLPNIILGAKHSISAYPKNAPFLVIVFETQSMEFQMQVTFKFK
ncbi:MAG: chemotaxis protein CheX [Cyanobacteria bacterium P01_H01_bin.74]